MAPERQTDPALPRAPDGSQVAYWMGAPHVAAAVPESGAVWVIAVNGGQPHRVGDRFTAARQPVWMPDGNRLVVLGYTAKATHQIASLDWWVVPVDGGDPIKTGAFEAMTRAGLPLWAANTPAPACWSKRDEAVLFASASGDAWNLWQAPISTRTGKINGPLKPVTTGAGRSVAPSSASNALAFASVDVRRSVWSIKMDLNRGTPEGSLERITESPASRSYVSLSRDARTMAFGSDQWGPMNIWTRDQATGTESIAASSTFVQRYPAISPSGERIAYTTSGKGDHRTVYVVSRNSAPEKLCDECLRVTAWSNDEKTLLTFAGHPYEVSVVELDSHRRSPLLRHPTYNLLYARFSPDERWVSFTARIGPSRGRLYVAPLSGPKPIPEASWIAIAEAGPEDWANWSPDGKTLYFTSRRDGHSCWWAQRIHPDSHQPSGEPFAVVHLHGVLNYREGGWDAEGGRIAMVLNEDSGNIWVMSRLHGAPRFGPPW